VTRGTKAKDKVRHGGVGTGERGRRGREKALWASDDGNSTRGGRKGSRGKKVFKRTEKKKRGATIDNEWAGARGKRQVCYMGKRDM